MSVLAGIEAASNRVAQIRAQIAQLAPSTSFASVLSSMSDAPSTSPATPMTASTSGDAVVTDAKRYLGVPYRWGGTDSANGLDCSGLVQRTYADLGISLPRTSAEQARAGSPVPSLDAAQPGDLVAFGSPVHHIGIYVGNGQMIDAPHTGDAVRIEKITEQPSSIRRIVSPPGTGTALPSWARTGAAAPYTDLFASAGAKYGVPPTLLAAVARAESGFNPRAVSSAGAQGLMQIMPTTARGLGVNPLDPAQAVDGAARLLSHGLHEFGSVDLALAAYNAGSGAVRRYGGVPPYAETQAYVRRVMSYLEAA